MMGEIIRLGRIIKDRARAEKERQAEENRIKFGRTKAEKLQAKAEVEAAAKRLEGHKREE